MTHPATQPDVQVICLTPVKNEAWILDRFLQCASLWADHIIVADQGSDDGSQQIALRYSKVTLLENTVAEYNEFQRQQMLIEAARRIPGKRLLVALDADEFLTANWRDSPEWDSVLRCAEGTVVRFRRINIMPDFADCWAPTHYPYGFMDNGDAHQGSLIHSARVPVRETSPSLRLLAVQVLHYQFLDWERMSSKHRWYQSWESLNLPQKSPVKIFRDYHLMYGLPASGKEPFQREWIAGYEEQGIDMTSLKKEAYYRWDKDVFLWIGEHGASRFRTLDIWRINWNLRRVAFGDGDARVAKIGAGAVRDPRSRRDKLIHRWLRLTQSRAETIPVKFVDKLISALVWKAAL